MEFQKTEKIFIVDDDPTWTAIISQILQNMGYTNISTFLSGEECLKYVHLNPNLVFLDYDMGGMNGLQVLQKIRLYLPDTGVVFCSANENIEVAVSAMKNGSFDYLRKSKCGPTEIAATIQGLSDLHVFEEKIY